MSTVVAYRAPSDPDAHHASSSPHTFQTIAPSARPRSHPSPPSSMSSSPHRNQTGTAPRPSVEIVRSSSSHNLQPSSNQTHPETHSPPGLKSSQVNHGDDSEDAQSSQIPVPSVEVKQEDPTTPETTKPAHTVRHRPRKLDLTTSVPVPPGRPSAPMTAKESAPLTAMQDIGLACLSPGFQTEDPRMSVQLQRSMDLREQQRQIIEARLQKGGKEADSGAPKPPSDNHPAQTPSFSKPPGTSTRRKGPPPGLSINANAAQYNSSEPRVIQSAPLNQTFTGLQNKSGAHSLSRQVLQNSHKQQHHLSERRPSGSDGTSGSQQYATYSSASQPGNRLPPIQDMFASENLGSPSPYRPTHNLNRTNSGPVPREGGQSNAPMYAPIGAAGSTSSRSPNATTQYAGALPSPAYPPPQPSGGLQPPSSNRPPGSRDRETIHVTSTGRDDPYPKVMHFGGHQPPTPPSPLPPTGAAQRQENPPYRRESMKVDDGVHRSVSGRRRNREEYERDYDEHAIPESERMEVDGERERERERDRGRHLGSNSSQRPAEANAPPASAKQSGGPGMGFGFGSWSSGEQLRHSPDTIQKKKQEFLSLCSRAWDLLHE